MSQPRPSTGTPSRRAPRPRAAGRHVGKRWDGSGWAKLGTAGGEEAYGVFTRWIRAEKQ